MAVAASLVLSSCGLFGGDDASGPDRLNQPDDTAPSGDSLGAGSALDPGDATFTEQACAFEVPTGTDPRCGTVKVPENWATGAGSILLSVAVFPGTGTSPAADPVVYLDGGPGGHSLDAVRLLGADMVEPLQARGDAVFFDQRGVGRSEPALDCPELTTLQRELEDSLDVTDEEAEARSADALRACRTRLEGQGIDLSAYDSINNAHDVEAIRAALGYPQWNLYGISYGTKLALEVMRQHPGGVRSVVIDSVYPPEVDSVSDNPATFDASYRAVVDACAQEPECRAAGDLAQRFRTVIATYDAEPVQVEVQNYLTGELDTVYLDGESIAGLVLGSLYSPEQFSDLPELVGQLEQGQTDAAGLYLSQNRTQEDLFSTGAFFAFECNEEVPFADPAEVTAALPPDPFGRHELLDYSGANVGPQAFDTCAAFGSGQPDPVLDEPVTSTIPTLVMAGRFDPVTPVAWAQEAASHLSASQFVLDPVGGHGVSPGPCGMGIIRQFLDDPVAAPDASCFDEEELNFLGGSDSVPVDLEPVTYPSIDGNATVSTVRPAGWTATDLDGDSVRQASFLDQTELIQLAGDQLLPANLEAFLAQTQKIALGPAQTEDRGGRSWQHRTGAGGSQAVEWYQTEIAGQTVVVVLVAAPSEIDGLSGAVLEPALDKINVTG